MNMRPLSAGRIALVLMGFSLMGTGATDFSFAQDRVVAVSSGRLSFPTAGVVVLKSRSAEYSSGFQILPPAGKDSFDLSAGRYLAADVVNLSDHQQRLSLVIKTAEGETSSTLALDPAEAATVRVHLPHDFIYAHPASAKGVKTLDTHHVTNISFAVVWPYEGQFTDLLHVRVGNLRLSGEPDYARRVAAAKYLPFVDKYGQYAHGRWQGKVTDDEELREDRVRETAAFGPKPVGWDDYGGWAEGPQLAATGHFRTEKVNGKWWLVTPEGHLFYSVGINVVKLDSDAPNGREHPDWYVSAAQGAMAFPTWNLRRKFGKDDVAGDYYDFVLRRMDSWGMNTIGNWSDGALTKLGRKPYVLTLVARPSGLPYLANGFYDSLDATFAAQMKAAVAAQVADGASVCAQAANDPMCIGFFIDNELAFPSDSAYYEPYFKACKEAVAAVAPHRLYLGCRFKSLRNSAALWQAAAKWCDVISVNSYVASVEVFGRGDNAAPAFDKPMLHSEFHFGTLHRGRFSAGLCPVGDQCARGRAYRRVVEGALRHPLFVGSHWFQYRDQPLVGRGDGENYQIGFVDVCDRPYSKLIEAARQVGETMYGVRWRGGAVE
ncbi:MAG: hypothetical protein MJ240_10540 [Kiritimatiellae bacterium]|nr:hypothetical protein [Kiritimatiellia bacterium]